MCIRDSKYDKLDTICWTTCLTQHSACSVTVTIQSLTITQVSRHTPHLVTHLGNANQMDLEFDVPCLTLRPLHSLPNMVRNRSRLSFTAMLKRQAFEHSRGCGCIHRLSPNLANDLAQAHVAKAEGFGIIQRLLRFTRTTSHITWVSPPSGKSQTYQMSRRSCIASDLRAYSPPEKYGR